MKVGIIGLGVRINWIIDCMLGYDMGVKIVAVADINREKAIATLKEKGLKLDDIKFYTDADEMLENQSLDGVLIGTRCSLHAKMAAKVLNRGIPLFLEKPIATNINDLMLLKLRIERRKAKWLYPFH